MINLTDIESNVAKVIQYSQELEHVEVSDLITTWYHAKRDFIQRMEGLIYELPDVYYFTLSPEEKKARVENFISMLEDERFIDYDSYADIACFIRQQAAADGFFTNTVKEDFQTIHGDKIAAGTKLLRAFKYFIDDKDLLHKIQDKASMIIQEDKIEGKLCLSVHPLDFLSLSENVHNWRSCHALDGEYRAGNLSYMCDNSTVICYLKSCKEAKLPHFPDTVPWNSKKWRVLVFFSDDKQMIFSGRQYPFASAEGINLVKDVLIPKALDLDFAQWRSEKISQINRWYPDGDPYILDEHYIPVGDRLVSMHTLIKDNSDLHFNDLLRSSFYDPIYAFKKTYRRPWFFDWDNSGENPKDEAYAHEEHGSKLTRFKIGSHPKCCCCNSALIYNSGSLLCKDCELEYGNSDDEDLCRCPICGTRFWADDGYWIRDEDQLVCPDCFDSEYTACDRCGEYINIDNVFQLEEDGPCYCRACYRALKGERD